jgi:two-component system chemotaxis response regulator CheB
VSDAPQSPHRAYDVVAVASSAGGITALGLVLAALPADFAAPVLVVQHLDPRHETVIADILQRHSRLTVKLAEDGDRITDGVAYVAPPDRHLLVGDGGILALSHSELVHFVRPSADLLFESLAATYGERAIACVLTGAGSDGSAGVAAVHAAGGTVIVQDPESAQFSGMPDAAVAGGDADYVLPLEAIPPLIERLVEPRST